MDYQVVVAHSRADRDDCRSSLFIRLRGIEDMRRPFLQCLRSGVPTKRVYDDVGSTFSGYLKLSAGKS